MKVINKILCFFSVLFLCVPLLCFKVSASVPFNTDSFLPEYYCSSSDYSSYLSSNSFLKSKPYCLRYVPSNYYFFDLSNPTEAFKGSLAFLYSFAVDSPDFYSSLGFNVGSDIYYVFYYGTNVKNGSSDVNDAYFVLLSGSPFRLVSDSSSSYFESDTPIYTILGSNYNTSDVSDFSSDPKSLQNNTKGSVYYNDDYNIAYNPRISVNGYTSGSTSSFYSYNFNSLYSNVPGLNFPDNYSYSEVPGSANFKDQIDVKLTPEFGLDMDRIDPLTNQSDYFKFEITNNSDSAIQWCAGIYDPELVTADTMDILSLSSWAYVCRSTYYDFSVKEDKGIFRTTYTYSGTLKTGSFDYHYLESGETFSDLIFWENIKINPNVIYHFFVNAVKTDLNYASLNINPPVTEESSDLHSVTVIEDSYYNTILEGASDFKKLDCNIYNIEFSCLSMPAFTTTVRGGNSILNTSGNDRYQLYSNYESVSGIDGLDTQINKNYTDPAILANTFNRSDVSVDIDSFSVDDVKSYITSCQSFFILIKDSLLSFPAFIWALICFGLTGLIVIAVVKALL